jgi:hypothetical protein
LSHLLSRAPAKLRVPIGLAVAAAGVVGAFFSPPATTTQWILTGIFVGTIVLAIILSWEWVLPAAMYCIIGALVGFGVLSYVSQKGAELGQERKNQAQRNPATTIIEFTDRSTTPAPGDLIVCSERFCGFHDGKTATVISLKDVRSIQSPMPQQQPPHTSKK